MLQPTQLLQILENIGIDALATLSIVDVNGISARHIPPIVADSPGLFTGIQAGGQLRALCVSLGVEYPPGHPVRLIALTPFRVLDLTLEQVQGDGWDALFLPPLPLGSSFQSFQELIARLRAPDGCPWDREQTHQSLRKHLIEESYETLAAMDENDPEKMREEFGDLLLQVVLNAQIASEMGEFTMPQVLETIHDKIIRRHPHVFGEVTVDGVGQVLSNWEAIKQQERKSKGEGQKSLLDGLPASLPALNQAQEFQNRAVRVGFDWPEIGGVLEKIREEIDEVQRIENPVELTGELGDLFFALVNLARWKGVDAESALRETNLKFKRRFGYIERRARELERPLMEFSLAEMDAFWNEAKATEKS